MAVLMPVIVKMPSPVASMSSMSASNTRLLRPMRRRTNGKNSTTDTPSATSSHEDFFAEEFAETELEFNGQTSILCEEFKVVYRAIDVN